MGEIIEYEQIYTYGLDSYRMGLVKKFNLSWITRIIASEASMLKRLYFSNVILANDFLNDIFDFNSLFSTCVEFQIFGITTAGKDFNVFFFNFSTLKDFVRLGLPKNVKIL